MSRHRNDPWADRESTLRTRALLIMLALAVLEGTVFFSAGLRGWWAAFWVPIVIVGLVGNWIAAVIVVRYWFVREERERDSNEQLHAIRRALQVDAVDAEELPRVGSSRRRLVDIESAEAMRRLPKIDPSVNDDDTKILRRPLL